MRFFRRDSKLQAREEDAGKDPFERLATTVDPTGLASEAYRTLRTNLLYGFVDNPPKVIVLTSPSPREGKSTTCANLGVVLAQADKSTLIVDCDLRRPSIHKIFGLRNIKGLVNVLAEGSDPRSVWQEPLLNLKVLTSGPLPPHPAELLESERFAKLLSRVRDEFEYVLVDAPPIQAVSDPAILASRSDGVLLVLAAQRTRKRAVRQAMRSLNTVGANVLGTVMNNIQRGKVGYRYGGYVYK